MANDSYLRFDDDDNDDDDDDDKMKWKYSHNHIHQGCIITPMPVMWPWQIPVKSPSTHNMMTSLNGNIFRVTGPLCGEFTGHQWIPRTKGQ